MSSTELRWFGESWNSAANAEAEQVDVPVNQRCLKCNEYFVPGARGLLIYAPQIGAHEPIHLSCLMEWTRESP